MSRTASEIAFNETIPGWMTADELMVLSDLSALVPSNGLIVEIGSFQGRSSYSLAKSNPTVKLVCIDLWGRTNEKPDITPGHVRMFNKHTADCSNITTMQALPDATTISTLSNSFEDSSIDLFFLDASHTNPHDWEYITCFLPKIKKGGLLLGHDYFAKWPDVIENVSRLEEILNKKVTRYKEGTVLWSFIV